MGNRVTRRHVAATLLGSTSILAQAPPAQSKPSPQDLLATAREQIRKNAKRLTGHEIPMATQPAFVFKA
jgi:hypothetical protein